MRRNEIKAGRIYETRRYGLVMALEDGRAKVLARRVVDGAVLMDGLPELVSPREMISEWVEPEPAVVVEPVVVEREPFDVVSWALESAIEAGRSWLSGASDLVLAGSW